jgi:hypothetical protein
MLAKLLLHNGINIDEDEDLNPSEVSMEIESQALSESGTKHACPTTLRELSPRVSSSPHHA